jgi:pimeloyl-ACP methyl ester carboxylesterase
MHRVEVGGLSVAYERAGDGPPLVPLHGFTHDSRAWRPQLQSLADQFTVIAWDAPGAGQSPDPPESFGIGDWAYLSVASLPGRCERDTARDPCESTSAFGLEPAVRVKEVLDGAPR